MKHTLSNINPEARIAECYACDSEVKLHRAAKGRWKCANKNKEYGRAPRRVRKMPDGFSFTIEEKNNLATQQEYKCAICQEVSPLEFDHNHETLEPRGLLCHKCNTGLGMFSDQLAHLESAVEYLKSHL